MEPNRQSGTRAGGPAQPNPWRYAGLGTELAAGIAGFTLIGYWVDRKFDTGDTGVITGAIVGAVGAFCHLIRRSLQMAREQGLIGDRRKKKHDNDGHNQRTD